MVFIIPNGILKEPSSPLTLKTFARLFRSMKINFCVCVSFSSPGN